MFGDLNQQSGLREVSAPNAKNTVALDFKSQDDSDVLAHHIAMTIPTLDLSRLSSTSISAWLLNSIAVLLLVQASVRADKSAADYFIRSLPGQPEGPLLKMHAG